MSTARDILSRKGNDVWSIEPQASILQAIEQMAKKEVGALLVMDSDKLVGIITQSGTGRPLIPRLTGAGHHVTESVMREARANRAGMHGTNER